MNQSAALVSGKIQERLSMTGAAALLGLGLSIFLEALVATPFSPRPALLVAPLLLGAAVQVVAGLQEWRREHPQAAVVLISFGLFTCSQISQLGSHTGEGSALLAQGSFLLFWGLYAALLAFHAADSGRPFQLLLGASAATLLLKAVIVTLAWTVLWPLGLACGAGAVAAALVATLRLAVPASHG